MPHEISKILMTPDFSFEWCHAKTTSQHRYKNVLFCFRFFKKLPNYMH